MSVARAHGQQRIERTKGRGSVLRGRRRGTAHEGHSNVMSRGPRHNEAVSVKTLLSEHADQTRRRHAPRARVSRLNAT